VPSWESAKRRSPNPSPPPTSKETRSENPNPSPIHNRVLPKPPSLQPSRAGSRHPPDPPYLRQRRKPHSQPRPLHPRGPPFNLKVHPHVSHLHLSLLKTSPLSRLYPPRARAPRSHTQRRTFRLEKEFNPPLLETSQDPNLYLKTTRELKMRKRKKTDKRFWKIYWHSLRGKYQVLYKGKHIALCENLSDAIICRNTYLHSLYGPGALAEAFSHTRRKPSKENKPQTNRGPRPQLRSALELLKTLEKRKETQK